MKEMLIVFGAAALAGLGIGSGGFYLLFLTEAGVGQYEAQGANLLFFVLATLASSYINLRRGALPLACLPPLLLAGAVGVVAGSFLTSLIPPEVARAALGLFLIGGGMYTLAARREGKKSREPLDKG